MGGGKPKDCAAAEPVEICAVHASDCVGGCTGAAAQKITAFFSCFEDGWKENECVGGDSKVAKCLASSGIDQTKHGNCKSDSGLIQQLQAKFHQAAKGRVHLYPTVYLDAKLFDPKSTPYDAQTLRKDLCKVGVGAACSSPSPAPPPSPPSPPSPPKPPSPPSPPSPSQCGSCKVCFNPSNHKCQDNGPRAPHTRAACEAKGHIWCGHSTPSVSLAAAAAETIV